MNIKDRIMIIPNIIRRTSLAFFLATLTVTGYAQSNSNHISLGVGALYERGLDATISVEHETKNHNVWEYFAKCYLKYEKDETAGHITKDSFWKNYRTWGAGIAYKPCVYRGKNAYGSIRLGGSLGSDTEEVVGWCNVGYEQNYVLLHGWHIYWQVKSDVCINGKDLFRTGIVFGIKIPTGSH